MPADTFCVYQGVALDGGGEACATDVVVIWSSFAPLRAVNREHAKRAPPRRAIYLGFVANPDLVVRAVVDPRRNHHAEMVGYALSAEEGSEPLAGQMTLRAVRRGSADVLSMEVREPKRFHVGGCALSSYSGTFLGVMQRPSVTNTSGEINGKGRL
jgi:hypothetical protein